MLLQQLYIEHVRVYLKNVTSDIICRTRKSLPKEMLLQLLYVEYVRVYLSKCYFSYYI